MQAVGLVTSTAVNLLRTCVFVGTVSTIIHIWKSCILPHTPFYTNPTPRLATTASGKIQKPKAAHVTFTGIVKTSGDIVGSVTSGIAAFQTGNYFDLCVTIVGVFAKVVRGRVYDVYSFLTIGKRIHHLSRR